MLSFIIKDLITLFFNMPILPLLLRIAMRTVYSLLLNIALKTGDVEDMLLFFDAVQYCCKVLRLDGAYYCSRSQQLDGITDVVAQHDQPPQMHGFVHSVANGS